MRDKNLIHTQSANNYDIVKVRTPARAPIKIHLNQFYFLQSSTECTYIVTAPQQMLLRYYYGIQLAYLRCFTMFQRLYMTAHVQLSNQSNICSQSKCHWSHVFDFFSDVDYKSQAQALSEEFTEIFSIIRKVAKSRFRLASKVTFTCKPFNGTLSNKNNFLIIKLKCIIYQQISQKSQIFSKALSTMKRI